MILINMHCFQFHNILLLSSAKQNFFSRQWYAGLWYLGYALIVVLNPTGLSTGPRGFSRACMKTDSPTLTLQQHQPGVTLQSSPPSPQGIGDVFWTGRRHKKAPKDRLWFINTFAWFLWALRYLEFFRIRFLTFFSCWNTSSVSEGH